MAVPIALQIDVYPIAQLKRRHFSQTSQKTSVEILMKVMLSLSEIHPDIVECVNSEIKILMKNDDTRHFARRYNAEARCSEFPI